MLREVFTLKQAGKVREAGALLSWLAGSENVAPREKKAAGIKGDITSTDAMALPPRHPGDREGRRLQGPGHRHRRGRDDPPHAQGRARQVAERHPADHRRSATATRACSGSSPGHPDFFDTRRGVAGLQPLHDRIQFQVEGGLVSMRQPQLELKPFDRDRLKDVALRLRELYPMGDPNIVAQKVTPEVHCRQGGRSDRRASAATWASFRASSSAAS